MPEFKLEKFVNEHKNYQRPILNTKNRYGLKVKTHNWQCYLEALPYDNEIRNEKLNLHTSHYKHFGSYDVDLSEFQQSTFLEPPPPKIDRKTVNLYNFNSPTSECKDADLYNDKLHTTKSMKNHYLTVTQKSYKRNFIPQLPKEQICPGKTFKKIREVGSDTKFLDDGFSKGTLFLQSVKSSQQFKSYNFCTGEYTDGSLYEDPTKRRPCFEIKYE